MKKELTTNINYNELKKFIKKYKNKKQDNLREVHKSLIEGELFNFIQTDGLLTIGVRMGFDESKDEYVIFQTTDYNSKGGFIKLKENKTK